MLFPASAIQRLDLVQPNAITLFPLPPHPFGWLALSIRSYGMPATTHPRSLSLSFLLFFSSSREVSSGTGVDMYTSASTLYWNY